MGRYYVRERNAEGRMLVDFEKMMKMAVVNKYFKEKEKQKLRMTYKSGGRYTCRLHLMQPEGDGRLEDSRGE